MRHMILASSVTVSLCLGLCVAGPSFAAQPSATDAATHASTAKSNVATRPAMKCLGDLRDFNSQMSKDGHWLGASRYGYGYPATATRCVDAARCMAIAPRPIMAT
jgi:hypothetical protein